MNDKKKHYITVALIVGTHGLNGAVKILPETDYPERFKKGTKYFLAPPLPMLSEVTLKEVFSSGKHLVFYFEEVKSIDEAEKLKGRVLQVPEDELFPIGEDNFFFFEVKGGKVFFETGEFFGKVTEVISTGAGEVFVIETEKGEILIPAVKKLVKKIDRKNRVIILKKEIYLKEFRLEE